MNNTATNPENNTSELINRIEHFEAQHRLERKKYWRHMAFFLGATFLLMSLLIVFSLVFIDSSWISSLQGANASNTKNIDYLQFVVPVLLTVGGFFVAFLGMNRLKDIDGQIDKIRENIKKELIDEKAQISQLRSELFNSIQFEKKELQLHRQDLTDSIDQRIVAKTGSFRETIKDELGVEQKKLLVELATKSSEHICDINNKSIVITSEMDDFKEKYSWLISSNKQDIGTILTSIASVYDAHNKIESVYATKPVPQNAPEIARHIVNEIRQKMVRGDQNDYHNLAAELARQNLYKEACLICEAGIVYFENNIDLLADWVKYGTNIGDYEDVAKAVIRLTSIPKNLWNWRAFDFTVDYYLAINNIQEADDLAAEFIEWLPTEERAYHCQADVYQQRYGKLEGVEKVIKVLQKPLEMKINCPMCANRLADLLSDSGKLEDALCAANRAIIELAQEQPSVNYAYVFYRRALICDRLFRQLLQENGTEHLEGKALEYAVFAYNDYRTAISSGGLSYVTRIQAQTRRSLMEQFMPEGFVLGDPTPNQSIDMEQLLELLTNNEDAISPNEEE